MMMGKALSLSPDLQVLPYDFDGYSEVSRTLYRTVARFVMSPHFPIICNGILSVTLGVATIDCSKAMSPPL